MRGSRSSYGHSFSRVLPCRVLFLFSGPTSFFVERLVVLVVASCSSTQWHNSVQLDFPHEADKSPGKSQKK